jgi:hypothetical protein
VRPRVGGHLTLEAHLRETFTQILEGAIRDVQKQGMRHRAPLDVRWRGFESVY